MPPATEFVTVQVVNILSRISVCERASIDECYIDITAEAQRRLAASSGQPDLPVSPIQVHVCGEVHLVSTCKCNIHHCDASLAKRQENQRIKPLVALQLPHTYNPDLHLQILPWKFSLPLRMGVADCFKSCAHAS